MNRILVTGANGFVGSHLVAALLENDGDDEIICLVRHTSDMSNILPLLTRERVRVVIGDVTNPGTLANAVRGVHYIFHLAAALKVPDRKRYVEVNTRGTENMLAAAWQYAAGTLKRFVFVSTEAAAGPSPGKVYIDEGHECRPVDPYGESKLQAERIAAGYMDRIPITIIRPSAIYGERERDLTQVIPAIESRIHPKIGFARRWASFIHAADLARGMIAAARSEKAAGQTYFLSNSEFYSDVELSRTMAKAAGRPFGIVLPIPKFFLVLFSFFSALIYMFFRGRPGMALNMVRNITQKYWICSPAKAKRDFGWESEINLLEGMKRTLSDYKARFAQLQAMSVEGKKTVWAKCFFLALAAGAIAETPAVMGKWFSYDPWWLIFVILPGVWGLLLGTTVYAVRRLGVILRFLSGFAIAFAFTYFDLLVTHLKRIPEAGLLGIKSGVGQALFLSASAGIMVLVVNWLLREFYKYRLRMG